MFRNVGKTMQNIAIFCLIFGFIFSIFMGAVTAGFLWNSYYFRDYLWIGFVVFAVGALLSWLSLLVVYAFGKIAECNEEQTMIMRNFMAVPLAAQRTQRTHCARCGSVLAADAVFCTDCGAPTFGRPPQ